MSYSKTNWTDAVTPVSATNLNKIEQGITDIDTLRKYLTAGGTGTVITVTAAHFDLTDGASVTFIASAGNSGAATTLNVNGLGAKSVYKPGGTTAPTIISGKAYTLWYSSTGGNFFTKASAEGNAVVANVLAGSTFSNDNDTGLIGTMTEMGTVAITPTANAQVFPSGHYDSGVILGDVNLISANIQSGVVIFGVSGDTNVVNTSNSNATSANIREDVTAYVKGLHLQGTMPNVGRQDITPSTANQSILRGYHDNFGSVQGSANLIASNIKAGVTIFGVTGTY
jgi:hypothetical protein